MRVTLVATYELGRQPFGLASPAAWLREAGVDVTTVDLSREPFRPEAFATGVTYAIDGTQYVALVAGAIQLSRHRLGPGV